MKFVETDLRGAFFIHPERIEDERGFFARVFCEREFAAHDLETRFVQCSTSFNRRKGTLRGMHYQEPPYEESKIVRCTRGAIYDVILDLRRDSSTYGKWTSTVLSAENGRLLYVPKGCAHGFQTLLDDSEVFYQIDEFFVPEVARTVRWDDPAFGIAWPLAPTVVSTRDCRGPESPPELKIAPVPAGKRGSSTN
jgi:dTDP-4-dehydrorhamnose 3,5-epimerase